jgi:hypothetical protein
MKRKDSNANDDHLTPMSRDMPPLRGLNLFGVDFYKDVAPTALGKRVPMLCTVHETKAQAVTTDAIIKKILCGAGAVKNQTVR